MNRFIRAIALLPGAILLASTGSLRAATYFPISDRDLLERSPVIVRATAGRARVVAVGGPWTETRTAFSVTRILRGSTKESIDVALPGGTLPSGAGSYAWMPEFRPGSDCILFLYRRTDGIYGVTELELGIFEIQRDASGTAFAIRPRFQASATRTRASLPGVPGEHPRELRAFLAMIAGEEIPARALSDSNEQGVDLSPKPPEGAGGGIRPMWDSFDNTNANLYRWNNNATVSVGYVDEDTSDSPGPQAHVPGGGLTEIQNAIGLWTGDSSSNINYSFTGAGSATVTIFTDDVSQFGGTGIPCSLGTVGLTSISFSGTHSFKSESYHTITGANVYLRRWDCTSPSSYLGSAFENVATHELGHSLGLGHPDQGTSPHDNTSGDESAAVMVSVGDFNRPTGLGSDDIEGICYLYGSCTGASAPALRFYTLTPCRIVDTRNPDGPYGGPSIDAGQSRNFVLTGQCGIAADAKSVSVNVTVVFPTGAGELTAYPTGVASPVASTISYPAGRLLANNSLFTLGTGGSVTIENRQTTGTAEIVIDTNGYFK